MYAYAFLKTPTLPIELPDGIQDRVELIGAGQLSVVVEPDLSKSQLNVLQEKNETLMQSVLLHDRVIRQLFLQTTILPLRFGTCFVSLQSLMTHLDAYAQNYLDKLDQFDNKAEYLLTLTLLPTESSESPVPLDTKGKEYFMAKKKRYQGHLEQQKQQRSERVTLIQQIGQARIKFLDSQNSGDGEKIYLLNDRQNEHLLLQQLQNWQKGCAYWQLNLGDANPPYHFIES